MRQRTPCSTACLSIVLSLAFRLICPPQADAAQLNVKNLNRAVVKIRAERKKVGSNERNIDTGAGIILGSKGNSIYALTAYHVIKGAEQIDVTFYDLRGQKQFSATVLGKANEELDIGVIKIDRAAEEPGLADLPTLPLGDKLEENTRVSTIGHPDDLEWQPYENTGTVSKRHYENDSRKFLYSSSLHRGNSGGPIFNEQGLLVGIVILEKPSGDAVGVKIDSELRLILEEWGAPTAGIGGDAKVTQKELAEYFKTQADLNNWIAPKVWQIKDDSLHLTNAPKIGFAKDFCIDKFEMAFDAVPINDEGFAWALNVKDAYNYYLFHLSIKQKKLFTYKVYTGVPDFGALKPYKEEDVQDVELKKGAHYRIEINVNGKDIIQRIRPTTGGRGDGKAIRLGTFPDAKLFNCGSIGFLTVNSSEFLIDYVIVTPLSKSQN
jgi:hypothetical protein